MSTTIKTMEIKENGKTAIIKILHDDSPENPLTAMDGIGLIYSRSKRHSNFNADAIDKIKKTRKYYVLLDYFEHSGCVWSVSGEGPQCQWDSVRFAGIWVPDRCLLNEVQKIKLGPDRFVKMREWARQACETYTQWCNGEVYGYSVRVMDETGEEISRDSCWGMYGLEYCETVAVEQAQAELAMANKD